MKAILLDAKSRGLTGKKVEKVRTQGFVPATVYGKDVKSLSLMVDSKEFSKVYKQAGETGLVDLKLDKETFHTLIADVQLHPLTHKILHVQFHAVKLTEKIKAHVPVELIGESPAVQSGAGLLLHTLNEIEVEALPTDLPEKVEVDVSKLSDIDQQITVGDIKLSVEVLTPKEEIVVKVVPAVSEEAKKEAEEAAKKQAEVEAAAAAETPPAGGTESPATATEAPAKE